MNACSVYDGVCIPPSKLSVVGCHGGERQPIIDTRKLVIGTCKSIIGTCNSIIGTCKSIIDTRGPIPPTPKVLEACARVYIPNDHRYTRPLSCGCSASDDAMLQRASTAIALHTYRHVVRSSVCALHLRGYVRRRGENMLQNTFVVRSTVRMGWI